MGNSGWNRPAANRPTVKKGGAKVPSVWKGIVAGLAVAVPLAALLVWMFAGGNQEGPGEGTGKKSGGISAVKPIAASKMAKEKSGGAASSKPKGDAARLVSGGRQKVAVGTDDVVGNSTQATEASDKEKKDTRLFTNAMDQLLAMVAPREPGVPVPPLPISDDMTFSEEEEKKILERLTADEKDSEERLERKELVQAMRDEYQEMKKRGWGFVDYVKALEAKARLDTEVLEESVKIHDTVFNDSEISDEKYLETLEKINKLLSDRGIKPIRPPVEDQEEGGNQK